MSIPASRARLSLTALGVLASVTLGVVAGLEALARRAEATGNMYPYKWEDWLRYLVPTLWRDGGQPTLLLTGPSTARENFLVEGFRGAFPALRVAPGAMSLGTLRDITAGLEYLEREYGREALPAVLVLGISPRFMAEIPRERPFAHALDRFGRHYGSLSDSSAAFGLTAKGTLDGVYDHLRFKLTHQSGRYRSAVAWAMAEVIPPRTSTWIRESFPLKYLAHSRSGELFGVKEFAEKGPREYALQYASPYRYQPTMSRASASDLERGLDQPSSWWQQVFHWDPDTDAVAIRQRSGALVQWAQLRGIELFVVRLPEHSSLRQRTNQAVERRFRALIDTAFAPVPVLNLRCLLPDDQFLDAEHAVWTGAWSNTTHVIGYMNALRGQRTLWGDRRERVAAIKEEWSRGTCASDP